MQSDLGGEFFEALWCTWTELSLWLVIGALLSGVIHVLVPSALIQRQLSGRWGPLRAVLLGIPLPLCSCAVIPTALQLKKDGARDGSVLGFLIATPQTGVDSMFASASLLGWPFAWFKVFSALLMGLLGGYGLKLSSKEEAQVQTQEPGWQGQGASRAERVLEARRFVAELVDNLAGWLVFGVLVSAVLEVFVPDAVFATIASWGSVWVTVAVLALSLPLYVCATASVPIAAGLVASGLPLGAALVFLMAGPATNLATMGALYRSVGLRALCWYLGTIIVGSVSLAYVLDQVLGWAPAMSLGQHHQHTASLLEQVCAVFFAGWIAWCLFGQVKNQWLIRRAASASGPYEEFWVEGLSCEGCVRGLRSKLNVVPGVSDLQIELESGRVRVFGGASVPALHAASLAAGHKVLEDGPRSVEQGKGCDHDHGHDHGHGHSHADGDCGHGHGHGHSDGDCGHGHGHSHAHGDDHGHSHAGGGCGHGHEHSHTHGDCEHGAKKNQPATHP